MTRRLDGWMDGWMTISIQLDRWDARLLPEMNERMNESLSP